ncbi:MAG: glycosyltransferase family 2 protein [Pseudomonadota bacterium]
MPKELLLSIVVPVYNEADVLPQFVSVLHGVLDETEVVAELVFVDDGSTDASWDTLCQLYDTRNDALLLRFSRNFGKEAAIRAGLERASGDAVVVMDSDLQHPPSLLPLIVTTWQQQSVDVVDAVKAENPSLPSRLFSGLFSRLTGYDLRGASDYKLISRRAVDLLTAEPGYNLFFRGSTEWLGLNHAAVTYDVPPRSGGTSKWGTMARLRLAITAITSFTAAPLHLLTLLGLLSLLFAGLLGLQTLLTWLQGEAVEGFTTVILLILLFGSLIILGLGILGAYLSKIHDEVRHRPRYLLRDERDRRVADDG